MCNSLANGGRRCPVHRNDSAMMLHNSGCEILTREQKEKVFSALRREGANTPAPTMEEWKENVLELYVGDMSLAGAAAERAYFEDPANLPDGKTYYALVKLHDKLNAYETTLEQNFQRVATNRGVSVAEIKREFTDHSNSVDLTRGAPVPSTFTQTNINRMRSNNLPDDRASVHALMSLENEVNDSRARNFETTTFYINGQEYSQDYDPTDGFYRLHTNHNNTPLSFSYYIGVPRATVESLSRSSAVNHRVNGENAFIQTYVSALRDHRFNNEEEASYASRLRRCESCGQFAALNHTCPETQEREEISSTESTTVGIEDALNDAMNASEGFNSAEVTDTSIVDNVPYEDDPSSLLVRENNIEDYVEHAPRGLEAYPFIDDSPNHLVTVTPSASNQRFPAKLPIDSSQDKTYDFNFNLKRINSNAYNKSPDTYQFLPQNLKDALKAIYDNNENATIVYRSNSVPDSGVAEEIEIVQTYNADKYITKVVNTTGSSNILYRRLMHPIPNLRFTEEEANSFARASSESIFEAAENRTSSSDSLQSISQSVIFDANLDSQPQISHNLSSANLNKIKNGKAIMFDISINTVAGTMRRYDDQGYRYGTSSGSHTVSGTVLVKKDEDDLINVHNNERSLKCSCDEYQANYYCPHIHYTNRHIGNVIQQMIPVTEAHPLLLNSSGSGMTLADRGDSKIVERDGVETFIFKGTPNLRGLGSTAGELRGSVQRNVFSAAHITNDFSSELTSDQIWELETISRQVSQVTRVWTPIDMHNGVSVALATGKPVDMPVAYTINEKNVDGRVTIVEDNGNVKFLSRSLRCECDAYAQNYRCEHIDFSENQPSMFAYNLTSNSVASSAQLDELSRRNTERVERESTIRRHMENHSFTRERAIEYIEELRVSREAREREERLSTRRRLERNAASAATTWERSASRFSDNRREFETYRNNLLERWTEIEPNAFVENRQAFYDLYREERNNRIPTAGRLLLPYRTENVLDGAGNGIGSRRFGVELELIADYDQLRSIGRELHSEGLTPTSRQVGYHNASRNGWANWSFEEDGTVDGEIVSPILDDSATSWEQIRLVTEIVNRNGASVNTSTGSHVHVSSGSYLNSTAKHAELLRFSQRNEDMLYRMSSNPRTGRHRGTSWCQPNTIDNYETINSSVNYGHRVLGQHSSHGVALNMEASAMPELTRNHIEFRTWDGTLDPSIIQAQVMMSVAMTDAAERTILQHNQTERPAENDLRGRGWHSSQRLTATNSSRSAHSSFEAFNEETEHASLFIDHLFRREADRDMIGRLFARTNWQS